MTAIDDVETPAILLCCRSCSGWRAVMVDVESMRDGNANAVAKGIRRGLRVMHSTCAEVRAGKWSMCECARNKSVENSPTEER